MIEKGRSNNKSLYLLLGVSLAILAGTAYGAYALLFNNSSATPTAAAAAKVEVPVAPKAIQEKQEESKEQSSTSQPGTEAKTDAPQTAKSSIAVEQRYSILIKKSDFKLNVLDNNKQTVASFDCALGKNPGDKEKSGDMKTPNGTFKVIEVCDASYWTHDFKDGKGEIKGAYGPWFFYLDTTAKSKGQWDGIGIHGTHDPSSIRTLASEGCIRLLNENVLLLKEKYIKVGTMVTIEE